MENDEAQPGRAGDPRVEAEALRQEVERLKRELREARGDVPKAPEEPPEPAPEPPSQPEEAAPSPPSPAEQERAEGLLREARVAEMRGHADRAEALVRDAAAIAPGSSEVLEALADRLVASRKSVEAKQTYRRAVLANPNNASAERKLAELVLKETQAQLLASGYMAITSEAVASATAAKRYNLIAPGFGQILLGETAKGLGLLAAWIVCWLVALQSSKAALGPTSGPMDKVLFGAPIFVALIVYAYALLDIGGQDEPAAKPSRPGRPKPPVDLEF